MCVIIKNFNSILFKGINYKQNFTISIVIIVNCFYFYFIKSNNSIKLLCSIFLKLESKKKNYIL